MVDVKAWAGNEKAMFSSMFGKGSKWEDDHDSDPGNWKPHTKRDNSEPVRNATAGDTTAEKPSIDGTVEILDDDPNPPQDKSLRKNVKEAIECDCGNDNGKECQECKDQGMVKESFHAGKFKLDDGSHADLSEHDAKIMNEACKKSSGTKMMKVAKKSLKEFNAMLQFVRTISEDSLMEVSTERLNKYIRKSAEVAGAAKFAGRDDLAKKRTTGIMDAFKKLQKNEAPIEPTGPIRKRT